METRILYARLWDPVERRKSKGGVDGVRLAGTFPFLIVECLQMILARLTL